MSKSGPNSAGVKEASLAETLRLAQEALRRTEEMNRRLVEAMPGGIVEVSVNGAILRANAEAQRILGLSFDELTRRYVVDFQSETFWEDGSPCAAADYPVSRCLATGEAQPPTTIGVRRPGGDISWSVFTAIPIFDPDTGQLESTLVTFIDITERKRVEETLNAALREREIFLAHKMESLGVLSGGIAHDFNNLLTIMLGRISVALLQVGVASAAHGNLVEAAKAVRQAQDLTQQLLTFAKGGYPVKEVHSLAELLRSTGAFSLSGSNATCQITVADDLWPVEIDQGQIGRAINNLVLNALQAMPRGGTVRLQAENAVLGAEAAAPLPPGRYVLLTVQDEGVGIPTENLGKVFDPYFTTKETGSGLGLAVTYSIIAKHGGHIRLDSKVGTGTAFHIYLPAAERSPQSTGEIEMKPCARGARILVMDDESEIRHVLSAMLTFLEFEVEAAADGEEAIRLYEEARSAGHPFAAVILDLTVRGGLGGEETVRRLRTLAPDLKAIVSSGYSTAPIMSDFASHGFSAVLPKPYDADKLVDVLNRVLGEN